jgi:hypothetical protein
LPCVGAARKQHLSPSHYHDPCIRDLPGTAHACCGHDEPPLRSEYGVVFNGYVTLLDGRGLRFYSRSGEEIRKAVNAALNLQPLPKGFAYRNSVFWYAGMTEEEWGFCEKNETYARDFAFLAVQVRLEDLPNIKIDRRIEDDDD